MEGDAWGYFSSLGVTVTTVEVLLLRRIPLLSAVSMSYASTWQKQEPAMEHLFSFTLLLCPSQLLASLCLRPELGHFRRA